MYLYYLTPYGYSSLVSQNLVLVCQVRVFNLPYVLITIWLIFHSLVLDSPAAAVTSTCQCTPLLTEDQRRECEWIYWQSFPTPKTKQFCRFYWCAIELSSYINNNISYSIIFSANNNRDHGETVQISLEYHLIYRLKYSYIFYWFTFWHLSSLCNLLLLSLFSP